MICEKPKTKALAAGLSVAILYSLCALAFVLFPGLTTGFLNTVNHGINLQSLDIGKIPFTFGEFFIGLIYITLYAMVAGYIYGAINNVLQRKEDEHIEVTHKMTPIRA